MLASSAIALRDWTSASRPPPVLNHQPGDQPALHEDGRDDSKDQQLVAGPYTGIAKADFAALRQLLTSLMPQRWSCRQSN